MYLYKATCPDIPNPKQKGLKGQGGGQGGLQTQGPGQGQGRTVSQNSTGTTGPRSFNPVMLWTASKSNSVAELKQLEEFLNFHSLTLQDTVKSQTGMLYRSSVKMEVQQVRIPLVTENRLTQFGVVFQYFYSDSLLSPSKVQLQPKQHLPNVVKYSEYTVKCDLYCTALLFICLPNSFINRNNKSVLTSHQGHISQPPQLPPVVKSTAVGTARSYGQETCSLQSQRRKDDISDAAMSSYVTALQAQP
ncbi:uncharacterized protein V6R79_015757 [Siganus canaliculatus]